MNNKQKTLIIFFISLIFVTCFYVFSKKQDDLEVNQISYSHFNSLIRNVQIEQIEVANIDNNQVQIIGTSKSGEKFSTFAPSESIDFEQLASERNIEISFLENKKNNTALFTIILLILIIIFTLVNIFYSSFKSRHSLKKESLLPINPEDIHVNFSDIKGCKNLKMEVQEFIEFFNNPIKYKQLGARIPKGLLLSGPSGTGKTMIAKALAKESNTSFISVSGSDFIELYAGVGASRVRELFKSARKHAPCIIFIDEIDAIGSKRSNGLSGDSSSKEHEQTLNQILIELDGFKENQDIILVASTNRPDILDPALVRSGRIDRHVTVPLPNLQDRVELLELYLSRVTARENINLESIARSLTGFSGASIASLVNEAAIFAARRSSDFVELCDLEFARDKLLLGINNHSMTNDNEKRKVAFHEAGHAIVAKILSSDPIYKVSIIPNGKALGLTVQLNKEDQYLHDKKSLEDRIAILMGGREAEQIFCDTLTTGASNDIEIATEIAYNMVSKWGMSDLGPVAFLTNNSDMSWIKSENMSFLIEKEVCRLLNEASIRARDILLNNRAIVESIATILIEKETIDGNDIDRIIKQYS